MERLARVSVVKDHEIQYARVDRWPHDKRDSKPEPVNVSKLGTLGDKTYQIWTCYPLAVT